MSNLFAVTVPKWGIEMQEGTVVGWHAGEGEAVTKGRDLVDIETDKIVNTMEAPASGVFARRLAGEGETLKVGALLGVIAPDGTDSAAVDAFIAGFKPVDASFGYDEGAAAAPAGAKGKEPPAASGAAADGESHASPAAARRARELGVNLAEVQGTGRGGRISTGDVEAFAAAREDGDPESGGAFETVAMSATRKSIAKRLVQAKREIPHFYLTIDIGMDAALDKRAAINRDNVKVSVNDIIARAVVLALQAHPDVNIQFADDEIRRYADVNLALAVATDRGLMTPVIRRAQSLSLPELAARSRELAEKARAGALERDDVEDGTFTLSNLGMFGLEQFAAVINPPQGAILAVGACTERVVMRGERPAAARHMHATLSCDHRAIDGALGARFLAAIKSALEKPGQL